MPIANYDKELGVAIAYIGMKCNFQHHISNSEKKALIVEGFTDECFVNRVKQPNVLCFTLRNVLATRGIMLNSHNEKGLILYLFQRLSNNPDFFGFPKGCGQWHIYGLIDRDYDDETLNFRLPRLFVTDTHDIETLILSTDSDVLSRINKIVVSAETINWSLFLSCQLACYRQALYRLAGKKQEIDIRNINSPNGTINFSAFVENDNIIPEKLIKLIYANQGNRLSNEKLNGLTRSILKDKQVKKNLDSSGKWKFKKETFEPADVENLWQQIRGHDILSAICFYNPEIDLVFQNVGKNGINRGFEIELIDKYDLATFVNTDLYQQMKAADLVSV